MNSLDLYAKIEPLIGFYEAYETLYEKYLQALQPLHVKSILDVGCGNGRFLELLEDKYEAFGIDLSSQMIERAKKRGVNAECIKMQDLITSYDALCAVADVLNYMNKDEVLEFANGVKERLKPQAYFLCDVNTLFGFEEVADGTMVEDRGDEFLSVEATFLNNELVTDITYFEKEKDNYKRSDGRIRQYYHSPKWLEKNLGFICKAKIPINLFSENEADKMLFVFQK